MISFFTERAKAFFGFLAVGVTVALMKAVEQASGFDIPIEAEAAITMTVTGWVVNYTTNVAVVAVEAPSFTPAPEAAKVAKFADHEMSKPYPAVAEAI